MKNLKIFLLIIPIILFLGCNTNSSSDKFAIKSGKEIVTQNNAKWYDIDSTQNKYAIYKFTTNQLTEYRFSDKSFTKEIDENFYPIDFSDGDHFQMLKDGITYSCEISRCNDDEFIGIYCTPNVSGMNPIMLCGWNSKQKAITNMP